MQMKTRTATACLIAALLLSSAATALLAQTAPKSGPQGRGYGGPPQTAEERALRQQACPNQGAGEACPQGGQRGQGKCWRGQGQGGMGGYGYRHGLRDGTGPRNADGTCPATGPATSSSK